jgi:hypothetical protein
MLPQQQRSLELSCGMTRLDLTLKTTGADKNENTEHPYRGIPDHPDADASHRVFHVHRAWRRLWTDCRFSGHNLLA